MKRVLFIMLATCAIVACSEKNIASPDAIPAGHKIFKAVMEQSETKVYNEGLNLYWEAGDEIDVFDKTDEAAVYEFIGTDGSVKGDFTQSVAANEGGTALQYVYAVYPSSTKTAVAQEGMLIVYLYDDQSPYDAGYIDTYYSNIMIAISENQSLQFKNLFGYLKVSIYGNGVSISKVAIKTRGGELISGYLYAGWDSNMLPICQPVDGYAYDNAYINFASPVALGNSASDALDCYFLLPPGDYASGFDVEFTNNLGQTVTKSVTSSMTIYRNKMTSLPALELEYEVIDSNYLDAYVGTYTFNTTSAFGWGDYSGDMVLKAEDSAYGNVSLSGAIDGYMATTIYGSCGVNGELSIPEGQIVGIYTEPDQDTGLDVDYEVAIYVADGQYYYSTPIPFTITSAHEMSYTYGAMGYYIGLLAFSNGTPVFWYDKLTVNSITYKPSAQVTALASARGYDVRKGLSFKRTPVQASASGVILSKDKVSLR